MAPEVLRVLKKVWDRLTQGGSGDDPQGGQGIGARTCASSGTSASRRRARPSRPAGVQIVDVANKAEFVDAMKPVYDKFAADEKLKDLVKRIQDTK